MYVSNLWNDDRDTYNIFSLARTPDPGECCALFITVLYCGAAPLGTAWLSFVLM